MARRQLLSIRASHNAQMVAVRALAKPFRGFSVDVGSSECSVEELLAEWIDAEKVLEEGRAAQ